MKFRGKAGREEAEVKRETRGAKGTQEETIRKEKEGERYLVNGLSNTVIQINSKFKRCMLPLKNK